MSDEIDIVASMTEEECRETLRDALRDVSRLTAAIKRRWPLAMGKGDGAIETAIRRIERCGCP